MSSLGKRTRFRPRGRIVDSRSRRRAIDSTQASSPSGLPRCADSRTDANSFSKSGSLTRPTQSGRRGMGQRDENGGWGSGLRTQGATSLRSCRTRNDGFVGDRATTSSAQLVSSRVRQSREMVNIPRVNSGALAPSAPSALGRFSRISKLICLGISEVKAILNCVLLAFGPGLCIETVSFKSNARAPVRGNAQYSD